MKQIWEGIKRFGLKLTSYSKMIINAFLNIVKCILKDVKKDAIEEDQIRN